jgi:hypothetical protein
MVIVVETTNADEEDVLNELKSAYNNAVDEDEIVAMVLVAITTNSYMYRTRNYTRKSKKKRLA